MRHHESDLQSACVLWYRLQYRKQERLLFAIPNGHIRNKITAAILKKEGVVAGCPDLLLLIPSHGHASLCIEMKAGPGRQTESQKQFQEAAETAGNKYVVCRSFDEFRNEINNYLNG
jgi:hypothetical protein